VVVHDLNLAAQYCDRVLLLTERGAHAGPVADILTRERLQQAFGVDVYVGVNERTGARILLPISSQR
jgi:iron complex transport system ATP-binding protein